MVMRAAVLLNALQKIGSRKKVAGQLGISPQKLNAWINNGIEIPLVYAMLIFFITRGAIPLNELSPNSIEKIPKRWREEMVKQISKALMSSKISPRSPKARHRVAR